MIELAWAPTPDDGEGRLLAVVAQQASQSAGQLFWRSAATDGREGWQALALESPLFGISPSPDGRYVAFSVPTAGTVASGVTNADLYLLELGQPQARHLTSDAGFEGLVTWVPVAAK